MEQKISSMSHIRYSQPIPTGNSDKYIHQWAQDRLYQTRVFSLANVANLRNGGSFCRCCLFVKKVDFLFVWFNFPKGFIQGPGEFAEGLALGVRSLVGHTVGKFSVVI